MNDSLNVSVVIPTYQREEVLLDTVRQLLTQHERPTEILVVDQSESHAASTTQQLTEWEQTGCIQWIKLDRPSIPGAMNVGLRSAVGNIVLFLDDDIRALSDLVGQHRIAHQTNRDIVAVVGQVLQPGEEPQTTPPIGVREGLRADLEFPFYSQQPALVQNVMAGNLSVRREFALSVGGFDEKFVGVAYRFETEFARRMIRHGGKIYYCPSASIRHLKAERGGTRSTGDHRTSADPKHGVGDYYFAIKCGTSLVERLGYMIRRPFREVITRFHMTHPWYIPIKLIGEFRAYLWARKLARSEASGPSCR